MGSMDVAIHQMAERRYCTKVQYRAGQSGIKIAPNDANNPPTIDHSPRIPPLTTADSEPMLLMEGGCAVPASAACQRAAGQLEKSIQSAAKGRIEREARHSLSFGSGAR